MTVKHSITKIFQFESAHYLPNHNGKCAQMHGHSYRLEVTVSGQLKSGGSDDGMVLDFGDVSAVVKQEIITKWDHRVLNEIVDFRPTAENLANEIFKILESNSLPVSSVTLWETPNSYATVKKYE